MITALIENLDKLIAEGLKLKPLAPDLFGTKSGSLDDSTYVSWRQRSVKTIDKLGNLGKRLINDINNYTYIQQPYDMTIDHILGNLKAAKEFALEVPTPSLKQKDVSTKGHKAMNKNVFIIHGHDETAKQTVASFIKDIGLEPVILHEKPNKGMTIIEKLLDHAENVNFAVAILTPDDSGFAIKTPDKVENRARQNVIFELGLFIGLIGRKKVVALHNGGVEIPSDYNGIVYISFDDSGQWKGELSKELKEIDDMFESLSSGR